MNTFTIIQFPEIQQFMDKPGFELNSHLINDERGVQKYGPQAYFVDIDWIKHIAYYTDFEEIVD